MKIGFKNLKNSSYTICRKPNDYITLEPNGFAVIEPDEQEVRYWVGISKEFLTACGLDVIYDELTISKLESEMSKGIHVNNTDQVSASSNTSEPDSGYTEDYLLTLGKEDLFNICDNFGIKYKRSNSVKTLVNLILGSDKI